MFDLVNAPVHTFGSPLIAYVSPPNSIRSPALTSEPSGRYAVHPSVMPRTRPSCESEVDAGCTEHPLIVFLVAVDQSGIVEPLDCFEPGRTTTIDCLQNEGSIKTPPSPCMCSRLLCCHQEERLTLCCPPKPHYMRRKHRPPIRT